MYESPAIHQSYPALKKAEINDAGYLKESPRKIVFRYDCDSLPLYENQEGSIRDYAECEGYWDTQATISSPDSTVLDQVYLVSSVLASELSSGTQISINLVVDWATPKTPTVSARYPLKKRKIKLNSSENLRNFITFSILLGFCVDLKFFLKKNIN